MRRFYIKKDDIIMIFKNIFKKQNNVYLVGTHRGEVNEAVTVAVFQNENDAERYIIEDLGFDIVFGGIYVIEEDGERYFANITEADVQ